MGAWGPCNHYLTINATTPLLVLIPLLLLLRLLTITTFAVLRTPMVLPSFTTFAVYELPRGDDATCIALVKAATIIVVPLCLQRSSAAAEAAAYMVKNHSRIAGRHVAHEAKRLTTCP